VRLLNPSLTVGALIGAPTVREGFPARAQYYAVGALAAFSVFHGYRSALRYPDQIHDVAKHRANARRHQSREPALRQEEDQRHAGDRDERHQHRREIDRQFPRGAGIAALMQVVDDRVPADTIVGVRITRTLISLARNRSAESPACIPCAKCGGPLAHWRQAFG
jgi:hypothetical protein